MINEEIFHAYDANHEEIVNILLPLHVCEYGFRGDDEYKAYAGSGCGCDIEWIFS